MRHRLYATPLRMFTSEDPLGFVDGYDLHLFAAGDPWNKWDPLGLASRANADPEPQTPGVGVPSPTPTPATPAPSTTDDEDDIDDIEDLNPCVAHPEFCAASGGVLRPAPSLGFFDPFAAAWGGFADGAHEMTIVAAGETLVALSEFPAWLDTFQPSILGAGPVSRGIRNVGDWLRDVRSPTRRIGDLTGYTPMGDGYRSGRDWGGFAGQPAQSNASAIGQTPRLRTPIGSPTLPGTRPTIARATCRRDGLQELPRYR